ncbi:MAG TPA: 50S ribosomal protein L6, partial [Thermoanaerobaculia bacterium]|nr:50S ribosomal protein L6 [Thermoanaerobaculia bacterium]
MSRIGRLPVAVPQGVDAKIEGRTLRLKGPKGELSLEVHPNVTVKREDGTLVVARKDDAKGTRALHGLTR